MTGVQPTSRLISYFRWEAGYFSPRSVMTALLLLLPRNQILALADQIVVSAASFLAFVFIARSNTPAELGAYALALSVLAFCLATQESLITKPYAIKLNDHAGSPAQHAFSVLILSLGLGGALGIAAALTAFSLLWVGVQTESIHFVWAVAAALPFVMMREFARRFAFAHMAVFQALILDLSVAVLTLFAAAILYGVGAFTAPMMLYCTGVSCAIAALLWAWAMRHRFAYDFSFLRPALRQCWGLGQWFLWGSLAIQVQSYVAPWLALVLGGAAVAGLYAACAGIVAFTNPVVFGFCNIMAPKFVRILQEHGVAALRRQALLDALVLGSIIAIFCLGILIFGSDIMHFLYRDEVYSAQSNVLVLLALAALAAAVGIPALVALAATGRAKAVAAVMLLTACVNTILIALMLSQWGLSGAAYALLIGEIGGAIARWASFWFLVPRTDSFSTTQSLSTAHPPQA